MKRQIILIAHNIRSAHNVGSLLRTADGLGIARVYLTGYTPYPAKVNDERLPHLAAKIDRAISKTSLGAEKSADWQHVEQISPLIASLRADRFEVAALEQSISSIKLGEYKPPAKIALIVGSEIGGIDKEILDQADATIEIPMLGQKESFNVAIAASIALYNLRFA